MDRIRVASLQYFVRPIASFEQFRNQVAGLVETAADYKCHMIVFPEYFTLQLLTLEDIRRPIHELVRSLALEKDRFVEMMSGLARKQSSTSPPERSRATARKTARSTTSVSFSGRAVTTSHSARST